MSETRQRGGAPIEFWFDFASGYAYFAALEIEALAERHGRTVAWRPFALGAAFKVTGAQRASRRSPAACSARLGSSSTASLFGATIGCRWSSGGSRAHGKGRRGISHRRALAFDAPMPA